MMHNGSTDPRWHLLGPGAAWMIAVEPEVFGLGGSEPVVQQRMASVTPCVRLTRLAVALHHVYAELLRVHSATVVGLGQFRANPERMGSALTEARHQHEVLYLVRSAVEALEGAVRRLEG